MRISVLGRHYQLEWFKSRTCDGQCDPPNTTGKRIYLHQRLRGRELVEALVHEMLHASGWHLDEDYVTLFANDVARTADQLGLIKEDADGRTE